MTVDYKTHLHPTDAELSPCPFCCMSTHVWVESRQYETDTEREFYVYCESCMIEGPVGRDVNDAIAEWTRREPPALVGVP